MKKKLEITKKALKELLEKKDYYKIDSRHMAKIKALDLYLNDKLNDMCLKFDFLKE